MRKVKCHKCNNIFYVGADEDLICPYCEYDNGKFGTLENFGLHKKTPEERREYIFRGNEDVLRENKKMS